MTDIQKYKQQHSETIYRHYFPSWNGKNVNCFAHDDKNPSLSIYLKDQEYRHKCHACNISGDCLSIIEQVENIQDVGHQISRLKEIAGITETQRRVIKVKTYDYTDESGELLFQTIRYDPKDFRQRKPDGKGGFIYKIQGIRLVPYNLPEVIKAKSIIIVEGEKDVEALKEIGLVATCNPLGAGKWKPSYNEHFKGKRVVIIPDNDKAGRDHALQVAKNLKGIVESIKVITLPDLKEKGDVSDWIQAGGTKEKLIEIIKQTPEWEEPKEPELISLLPTLSDIASLNLTVEYALEGLIPEKSNTIFYGKGGRGKTTLMMQAGYCIAEGIPFEGLTTKRMPVVYLDYDNPLNVIVDKAKRLGNSSNFHYWHISSDLRLPKMDKNEWETFKRLPNNALLIFDTLKSCQGLDMNKDETMAFILERFRELRDMGFTLVILHHTPKSSDTIPKNNTTITDNADHVIGLVPLIEEGESNKDGILRFGCGDNDKSRYPKHHICLSFDGEMFEHVSDPEDARIEDMKNLIAGLTEDGGKPNQSKIVSASRDTLGLNRLKTIDLLNKGESKHWKSTRIKELKNQKVYELISVVKLSDPIYTLTTEQLPEKPNQLSKTTHPEDTSQNLDNIELSSCQEGTQTTQTTEVIDLENEEFEIIE